MCHTKQKIQRLKLINCKFYIYFTLMSRHVVTRCNRVKWYAVLSLSLAKRGISRLDIEWSPWQADSHSADINIPNILRNPTGKCPPVDTSLPSWILSKLHFNIIIMSIPKFLKWYLPWIFWCKNYVRISNLPNAFYVFCLSHPPLWSP